MAYATKFMASGALIFNEKKLLIVKPHYSEYWDIPGGIVEESESPLDACLREVKEEVGLDVKIEKLLLVQYREFNAQYNSDSLVFIFLAQEISNAIAQGISFLDAEIEESKFVEIDELHLYFSDHVLNRTIKSMEAMESNFLNYYNSSSDI